MKKFFYICNWKSYLTFDQAHDFIASNEGALTTIAKTHNLIICPSFDAISSVSNACKDAGIVLGAQDCSAHNAGAYTGQVLATSLKQIGCSYCIIGHWEVRKEHQETTATIIKKAENLLEQGISPIFCIGESAKEYELELGAQAIEQQLAPFLNAIKPLANKTIGIAYEPQWMIGEDKTPATAYLISQLQIIKQLCNQIIPEAKTSLFYGGNVNELTIKPIKEIALLDGFLIGSASTDFQKLQKIVSS